MLHSPDPEHIWLDDDAFMRMNRVIAEGHFSQVFILVDQNTHEHCLPVLLSGLEDLSSYEVLEVEAGENSKSPEVLHHLWQALSELEADRHSLIINLGGGVVTDLGGFLAGTFLRGLAFINVPTSLLAMVDASVGGKNGINLNSQKNRVGLFLEPIGCAIWPQFLDTLPLRERRSGYVEMLKHGLISDADYWRRCLALNIHEEIPSLELITQSIAIKKAVVDQDYRETGLRKVLNFGHSFGHALESLSMNSARPLLHGEAIALGMMGELSLSVKLAGLHDFEADKAISALRNIFPQLSPEFDDMSIMPLIRLDKKNRNSEYRFSLLEKIGRARGDVPVTGEAVLEALAKLRDLLKGTGKIS